MKRGVLIGLGTLLLAACNLPAASQATVRVMVDISDAAPSFTDTPVYAPDSTPGPTPTLIPPEACPPFAFDSLEADITGGGDASVYIGKHYNELDAQTFGAGYRGEVLDDVHIWIEYQYRGRNIDLLERMICRTTDGKPFNVVRDALVYTLEKGQSATRTCWEGASPMTTVLAIGSIPDGQPMETYMGVQGLRYARLDMVYLMDTDRERFVSHPTGGVVCFAPFEGGD